MGMLSMLLGGAAAQATIITLTDRAVTHTTGGAASANAEYRLGADGIAYTRVGSGSYVSAETWCSPVDEAGNYEARVTVTSGTLSTGTTGSWLSLASAQTWTRTANAGALQSCTMTVEVRRTGSGTVLDSATITLEADALA